MKCPWGSPKDLNLIPKFESKSNLRVFHIDEIVEEKTAQSSEGNVL